jgi:hypothetical protein
LVAALGDESVVSDHGYHEGQGRSQAAKAVAVAKGPRLLVAGTQAVRPVSNLGLKASKPFVNRRARNRVEQLREAAQQLGEGARTAGEVLAVYGPMAAYTLGLAEPPKTKRTGPWIAAGIVIGASAVYFVDRSTARRWLSW